MGRRVATTSAERGAGVTPRYFYAPLTCSLGGMIVLEEVGCRYQAVEVDLSGDRSALLAVSAAGKVPTLEVEGAVVTETIAILVSLHHRFPRAIVLPDAENDFGRTISLLSWCASSLHIARRRFARPAMFAGTPAAQQQVRNTAEATYRAGLGELDGAVANAPRSLGLHAYALVFLQWR